MLRSGADAVYPAGHYNGHLKLPRVVTKTGVRLSIRYMGAERCAERFLGEPGFVLAARTI
jgi:hypothetical protein